jgi:hypothetical protein
MESPCGGIIEDEDLSHHEADARFILGHIRTLPPRSENTLQRRTASRPRLAARSTVGEPARGLIAV